MREKALLDLGAAPGPRAPSESDCSSEEVPLSVATTKAGRRRAFAAERRLAEWEQEAAAIRTAAERARGDERDVLDLVPDRAGRVVAVVEDVVAVRAPARDDGSRRRRGCPRGWFDVSVRAPRVIHFAASI